VDCLAVFLLLLVSGLYSSDVYSGRLDDAAQIRIEQQLDGINDLKEVIMEAVKILITRESATGEGLWDREVFFFGFVASLIAASILAIATIMIIERLVKKS
jgi:hypothetical protein